MHRLWLCVPMIALLLAGCGRLEVSEAEQLALEIRGEYLELERCSASLEITADYGQRVYQFGMEAQVQGEDAALTLTAPETVAGLTARWAGEAGTLEYDGVAVETGALDPAGLETLEEVYGAYGRENLEIDQREKVVYYCRSHQEIPVFVSHEILPPAE